MESQCMPTPSRSRALMPLSDAYLNDGHRNAFGTALQSILATDHAELTMAQLIDGLPLMSSVAQTANGYMGPDHPLIQHNQLCEGALVKARALKQSFDPDTLHFQSYVLRAYADSEIGSRAFRLRLLEMIAVSVHQIAVNLFQLKPKSHTAEEIEYITKWKEPPHWFELPRLNYREWVEDLWLPSPTLFNHMCYRDYDIYPEGVADVAGYWAEDKILGGVLVFDRGQTGFESNAAFYHNGWQDRTQLILRLLDSQILSTTDFLLGRSGQDDCPLPWAPEKANRYRLHPWDAIVRYHVFRDPWERKVPEEKPPERDTVDVDDVYGLEDLCVAVQKVAETGESFTLPDDTFDDGRPEPEPNAEWILKQGGHLGPPFGTVPLPYVGPPEDERRRHRTPPSSDGRHSSLSFDGPAPPPTPPPGYIPGYGVPSSSPDQGHPSPNTTGSRRDVDGTTNSGGPQTHVYDDLQSEDDLVKPLGYDDVPDIMREAERRETEQLEDAETAGQNGQTASENRSACPGPRTRNESPSPAEANYINEPKPTNGSSNSADEMTKLLPHCAHCVFIKGLTDHQDPVGRRQDAMGEHAQSSPAPTRKRKIDIEAGEAGRESSEGGKNRRLSNCLEAEADCGTLVD